MPQDSKAVVLGLIDAMNRKDWDAVDDYLGHECTMYINGATEPRKAGPGAYKESARNLQESFEGFTCTVEEIFSEGDLVCVRYREGGKHIREVLGFPATNREVIYAGLSIIRVEDGKVVDEWAMTMSPYKLQEAVEASRAEG